ncbi:MAG: HlyD family efflux transporter periplasmic adaptor subunit [Candidatus Uhrbacteria bacterium]
MRFYKRKLFWVIFVVVIVAIGGSVYYFTKSPEQEIVSALVEKGTLIQTVESTGVVEADREIELAFETTGTVAGILVEPGDEVMAGQPLMTLSSASALIGLSQAQATLDKAQANLNQTLAGESEESVGVTEAQLAEAETLLAKYQTDLENAKAVYAVATKAAQVTVDTEYDDWVNTLVDNQQDLSEVYDDALTIMQAAVISVSSGLTEADNIIGVENATFNTEFRDYLSVLNSQYIIDAKNSYPVARAKMLEVEGLLESLSVNSLDADIAVAVAETREMLNLAFETLNDTRHVLDATQAGNADLSDATLNTYKSNIDTDRDAVNADLVVLNNQEQLISSTTIATQTAEDNAENAYEAAYVALEQAQATEVDQVAKATALVATQTAAVATATANLVYKEATPRSVDTAALEAQVKEAGAAMALAQEEYNKTIIVAPFAGQVTDINYQIGEQVSLSTVAIGMLAMNEFQIVTDIDEADIIKLTLDDPVEITFDAFGDDLVFNARVAKINPAEKSIEGVVYYEVTVYLNEPVEQIRSGMSADIMIITEQIEDVVLIPSRAILTENFEKYTRVYDGDEVRQRMLEVGIRGDGGVTQVISGVNEGEEVVITIREK